EIRDIIKDRPLSMHGPYFKVEHTAEKGTESYDYAMEQIEQTLRVCEDLNINHLVFHHNNKKINDENKLKSLSESKKNLQEFNEKEFIEMCKEEGNNVLIDIGHVNANKWSLENIITSLKNQITHYHLHNNSAGRDDHNRIHDGSLDFERFISLYNTHTPNATLVLEYNYDLGNDIKAIQEDLDYLFKTFKANN